MATMLRLSYWTGVDVFTALTILHHIGCGSAQPSLSSSSLSLVSDAISPTTITAPLPTTTSLPHTLVITSSVLPETPSASPPPITTTEDPIQRHLALIIGVPTGVGLSIIGLSLCMLWLACSSYCEYRKSLPQQPNTAGGTRSTNAQANTNNSASYSKSGSMPMKPTAAVSTSASESQAFQPVPDPEPESDPTPELESDTTPDEAETEREQNGQLRA